MIRPLLFALLASTFAAQAELKWDRPIQEFRRTPDDRAITARYVFKNVGTEPVEVTKVRTSCGCTTARLEKKSYAPGESGTIEATFSFGGRKGEQRKGITVATKDGQEYTLELRCWIEEALALTPALVFWRTGEANTAKTVELAAPAGWTVGVKAVRSDNPRVTARLQTIEAGKRYAVAITPADTAQREAAKIAVETNFPPDSPRTYTIHVRIK